MNLIREIWQAYGWAGKAVFLWPTLALVGLTILAVWLSWIG